MRLETTLGMTDRTADDGADTDAGHVEPDRHAPGWAARTAEITAADADDGSTRREPVG